MFPKILVVVLSLASIGNASPLKLLQSHPNSLDEIRQFQEMIKTYDRHYADDAETLKRFEIFASNLKKIEQWNREAKGETTFGVTQFSDRTEAEKKRMFGYMPRNASLPMAPHRHIVLADDTNWDWRVSGVVTPVKDQGSCGSCWSFATAAVVESANALAGRGLITLAEQQMVDCIEGGCDGGVLDHTMGYAQDHGLPKESDYPYRAQRGQCHDAPIAARLKQMYDIPHNEDQMRGSVHDGGPMAVAIAAADAFQHYKSGILSDTNCPDVNHAVTIVGYGNSGGQDYWLIKNSWGTGWGEGGYIRVRRGINWCQITSNPVAGAIW